MPASSAFRTKLMIAARGLPRPDACGRILSVIACLSFEFSSSHRIGSCLFLCDAGSEARIGVCRIACDEIEEPCRRDRTRRFKSMNVKTAEEMPTRISVFFEGMLMLWTFQLSQKGSPSRTY